MNLYSNALLQSEISDIKKSQKKEEKEIKYIREGLKIEPKKSKKNYQDINYL